MQSSQEKYHLDQQPIVSIHKDDALDVGEEDSEEKGCSPSQGLPLGRILAHTQPLLTEVIFRASRSPWVGSAIPSKQTPPYLAPAIHKVVWLAAMGEFFF